MMANKIVSLQFLRAFACLSVLFTHVLQSLNIKPFGNYFVSGGYGVDLFFILSGFLIYLTTKNNDSWKSFAIKRFFRIFPLYWFCVILFIIWHMLNFNKEYSMVFYIQNFFMLPWSGLLTSKSLIVGVAWSTVYEVYFYLVFTLLLFFNIRKKYIIGMLILLFLLFKISYKVNFMNLNENSLFLFLYSIMGYTHFVPFVLGVLIAIFFQSPILNDFFKFFRFKKIVFIIIHLLYLFILTQSYNNIISYLITIVIFLIWLKIDYFWKIDYNNLMSKFFIKMGDISFSIYLLHTLILRIIKYNFNITNLLTTTILAFVISIVFSLITYKFIENPFINLSKKIIKLRIG